MITSTSRAPRIGVFGGTFDPPHIGHLIAALELRYALKLDRLLFVPAGRPPHKPTDAVASNRHRLEMLRLAIGDNAGFELSTIDVDRAGPSFTSDLLQRLDEHLAPARLVFLMGEDSLRDLPEWHQPGRIAALAEIGVASRPGVASDLNSIHRAVPETRNQITLVPIPGLDVSSSDIRRRVATGAPITYQVPALVERYILDRGLYRGRA